MKTIEKAVQSEITIKKSQFICSLFPSKTKKESKEIIQKINQEYHDATHNCTAYITNDGEGYDDNGEPSGTAGKPMINALRKNDLHNITAVVTRYFGGIKLGAGGLVRAYSKSVLEAIELSDIIEVEYYDVYNIIFDYCDLKNIESEIRHNKLTIIKKEFTTKISYDLVSKDNRNIINIFEKYQNKAKINFKNKQILKKIK
ncbi:YigZ family protein [uncultured Methanobrevibacter sp.]|uniref:YigZ family protein n=1 Tax=uncultured Methanobrevibacter sp. TaxID=253161 RepID=UPI00260E1966|nr:YigZ family protein [uncultured Methanobrevibacter sp.]